MAAAFILFCSRKINSMQQFFYAAVYATLFVLCLCEAETDNIPQQILKCSEIEKSSSILDTATDSMDKAKSLFPDCIDDEKKEEFLALMEVASNLISKVKKNFPTCPDPENPAIQGKPMDCWEVLQCGNTESGVYTIWPRSRVSYNQPLTVYCDMDTDGGGWTVIQRRGNFSTPEDYFYKGWESYKTGFGDLKEEFWMGNDNIYAISNQAKTAIRFDLEDAAGETGYGHYDSFWIEDEQSSYTLHIGGYNGAVGDSMDNNVKFSTNDQDNDEWPEGSCAEDRRGAWWYKNCAYANLNGLNQPGVDSEKGILWYMWREDFGLASVEIKLRREKIQIEKKFLK